MQQRWDEWFDAKLHELGFQAAGFARAGIDAAHPRGFDPGLVSRWRRPPPFGVVPRPATLTRIATVLGVSEAEAFAAAGLLPPNENASALLNARRRAIQEQYDRWIAAVGPNYEEYFWRHLSAQGDATVALIRQLGIAISDDGHSAVSGAVSEPSKRRQRRSTGGQTPLTNAQRPSQRVFQGARVNTNAPVAA